MGGYSTESIVAWVGPRVAVNVALAGIEAPAQHGSVLPRQTCRVLQTGRNLPVFPGTGHSQYRFSFHRTGVREEPRDAEGGFAIRVD